MDNVKIKLKAAEDRAALLRRRADDAAKRSEVADARLLLAEDRADRIRAKAKK